MSVCPQWGPHMTIIHDVLDLLNPILDIGGQHWRPVQTCLLQDPTEAILLKQHIKFLPHPFRSNVAFTQCKWIITEPCPSLRLIMFSLLLLAR